MFTNYLSCRRTPRRSAVGAGGGLVAAFVALAPYTGCSAPAKPLTIRDTAGNVVATGTLRLPERLPNYRQFEGTWELLSSTPGFPKHSTSSGHYVGTSQDGWLEVRLNGDVCDSNVNLHGYVVDGVFSGPWGWEQFRGGSDGGTFVVGTPATRPTDQ